MNEAGQGGWLDDLLEALAERLRRPAKRRTVRLELERLEDRLTPATTINILHAAFGAGSLDNTLVDNEGVISTTDGGNAPATLSDSALALVGPEVGLNITAQTSILFNDLMVPLDLGANPVTFDAMQGDITFANPSNTLMDDSGGSGSFFFQASGNLDLGNLDAAPFETINLQAGGSVSAGALTAVNGFIFIQAGGAMTLNAAVDAGNGPSGGYVTLNAGGPVDASMAPIQAMQLMLGGNAAGSFDLTNAGNAVDDLSGDTGGAIDFFDSTALTLGVSGDVNTGLTTTGAPITIVAGGPIDVEFAAVSSGGAPITIDADGALFITQDVLADDAPVELTVSAAGQALTLTNGAEISGDAVALTADGMSLSSQSGEMIDADGGPVVLAPFTSGLNIELDGASGSRGNDSMGGSGGGDLMLLQTDLDAITAGDLQIGSPNSTGDITIADTITDAGTGWNTLALAAGGDIEALNTGFLQVTNLALEAGTGIGDAGGLLLGASNLAFANESGAVDIQNNGALTIADVEGAPESLNGGPTTLSAAGPITFEADVAIAGSLAVTAAGSIAFEADVTTDGALTVASAGPITFEADVTSAGALTVETTEAGGSDSPEEDITVLSGVTVESTGGDVVLQAADSIVLESGSVVESDTGAVDLAVSVNDPDNDGVFDLQGSIVAPQGVTESPAPDDLELSLGGSATTGGLPTTLNGAFADTEAGQAHTVVIDWGDNSPDTTLTLAAGVNTFSSSHSYASAGTFTATVLVADSSEATTSSFIVVPVLPAGYGSVAAVEAQPGQTATVSVSDPATGATTTITLVRAPGAGGSGELLAAKLLNASFPSTPGTILILAAFDFREFFLATGDRAVITVSFPAIVPAGTSAIVQYLDPNTGKLETFNPGNRPGYLTITISPGRLTVTIVLDDTTIPKLTQLTATEFTVSAAVPAISTMAVVSQSVASADVGETAPGRTAAFQSTSQLTFGLATSQSVEASANLLALDTASSSGGDEAAPADAAATAAARAAWAQFVANEFPNDPEAVWDYGGDDALRLWLANHHPAPSKPPPVAPAPAPAPKGEPAPAEEEARLEAFEFFLLEALEAESEAPPAGRPAAANNGRRPPIDSDRIGAPAPLAAPYVWAAALGGLMLAKPERKRKLKIEGPPEGWRR